MARQAPKLTLSPSRDIPLDRLTLSQSNVRRVKAGVSIETLADDIARRGLLQSLNVRPILDGEGQETGRYEIPAGGRRFRALELLVKRKRLASNASVPCVVRAANDEILAEDDSLAENAMREALHPLDQFRAMQAMVDKGEDVEAIAANFNVTPAVVRQRLKLASVSPRLHEAYADDRISLEQLMAFTISDDFERQIQVFEMLPSPNAAPSFIRQKLTENVIRAADKRALFVTAEAYVEAGGGIVRDLFEADGGGWLTDPALLDRLVDEKLKVEGERLLAEGWKWTAASVDLPWDALRDLREIDRNEVPRTAEEEARVAALEAESEALDREWAEADDVPEAVHAQVDAINAEYDAIVKRPLSFAPDDIAIAGAFVSIERDGSIRIDRGYVRSKDEPAATEPGDDDAEHQDREELDREDEGANAGRAAANDEAAAGDTGGEETAEGLKPLPDRLVSDLTAWRTLALQDAFAQQPKTAYLALLHALVLGCFYGHSRESCVQISANRVYFSDAPPNLRDCAPAEAIDARGAEWKERLPKSDKALWDHLLAMEAADRAMLLAHCASLAVNAQAEIVGRYDNGRISAHGVERRIAHSNILARAVGLDVHAAGWRPTVDAYFGSVTKPRILADVAEARGENFAGIIDHLKKADMAREAERLLEDTAWLPVPLRTPGIDDLVGPDALAAGVAPGIASENEGKAGGVACELPAFLADNPDDPLLADDADDADLPAGADDSGVAHGADDLGDDGDTDPPVAAV
ncbi:ParB family chromosome partitioning protein [Sphingopyxis sp. OAS728]|uniref:ParB/RepB/Spo0J family partition protein n=1 Tax=Sphingopyxis sp. OAS728 TaxID=2663823 RepID=UPI00178A541A|nr:ParB/RepB/Spo0J family partition protein [Sphingopyxis sp. OAS728]MBE1529743.1 ParB family chromosome partitioning protein [Sphingopyxis sp. OAS728]